jgi:1-acyl-sn-glycerol-3-phosphate acyltransferase
MSQPNEEEITSGFSPWLTPLSYFLFGKIILPFYFNLEVNGRENLPQEGATILAPTHRSRWDPLILAHAAGWFVTGRQLRYMVLEEQTKGFQGWFVRRLGGFPVDRDRPSLSTIRYSIELLQNKEMLVLFPEGHILPDNEIKPLKSGVARIALQAASDETDLNLKIVPISIRYEHPAPPPWRCGVRVNIGSALAVDNYRGESVKKASKTLTTDLEKALKELHK